MQQRRRSFYMWMAAVFPVFLLLHWNGLFAHAYWWALVRTGNTDRPGPQFLAALVSSVVIFALIAAAFEAVTRLPRSRG